MRCLRILLLTNICPILRYYMRRGGGGLSGRQGRGGKDYTERKA
jgi:hypothetical protein